MADLSITERLSEVYINLTSLFVGRPCSEAADLIGSYQQVAKLYIDNAPAEEINSRLFYLENKLIKRSLNV